MDVAVRRGSDTIEDVRNNGDQAVTIDTGRITADLLFQNGVITADQ